MAAFATGALALLALAASTSFARKPVYGGPGEIGDTRSLRDAIESAHRRGKRLHIIFVHGIRAAGPGESARFATRLAGALGGRVDAPKRTTLDLGAWPVDAAFLGAGSDGGIQIWRSDDEWKRSQPFVERSQVRSASGNVVIDELNYWPLLFPLKCRFLLEPEHDLSGNDVEHLKLCESYGWLAKSELDTLLATRPRSGGGAKINTMLKHQIMNWGLSDAVIALGPMRTYLNDTVEKAFGEALKGEPDDQDYVVVSESLGSFVVLDAYAAGRPSVGQVLDRTADLYFLANQFPLLELARIEGLPAAPLLAGRTLAPDDAAPPVSPFRALRTWAARQAKSLTGPDGKTQPKQIVAFSDPSDLLTYRVPPLKDILVVNVYDRNEGSFLGLFANPLNAHVGHVDNKQVWDVLMRRGTGK